MKPVVTLHETYQAFVIEQLQKHYSGGLLVLVSKDWLLISKLWITNLTKITTLLQDGYNVRGPAPRAPASVLRSFLVFLLTKPEIGIIPAGTAHWNAILPEYHLYMLTAATSPYDLPLYPRLHPASRHDEVSFVTSSVEFSQRFTLGTVDKMLLDAAHDAGPIYDLLLHQKIEPFIDLNVRGTNNLEINSDIKISPDGIPICSRGKKMKHYGFDHSQKRHKWKCSMIKGRTTSSCPKR